MTIPELAEFIRANMPNISLVNAQMADDLSIVVCHTRQAFRDYPHITEEHMLECCAKTRSLRDYFEMCLPLAIVDSEMFWHRWGIRKKLRRTRTRRT